MKKKKGKVIFLIIISILLLGGIAAGYFFYQSKRLIIKYDKKVTVNINQVYQNTKAIKKIKNGSIETPTKKVDTSKVGEQKITIKIKNAFRKIQKITYTLKVVDKEAPVITFNPSLKIEEGQTIDLLSGVSATDNSSEEIPVTVEGEYDTNTPNTYELTYVAKDSSGNETKEKFQLEVTKKPVVVNRDNYVEPNRTFTTSNGHKGEVKNGITYIDGIMIANKTYPLPSTYNPGDLTSVTVNAFDEMRAGAASAGYNIYVVSGFRSYNYQKNLYNRYVSQDGKQEADTYSARPGHSEHQTGLAFDLNQVDRNFGNTPEGKWLSQNAYKYGFILRYPEGKTNETGYIYEAWHFRYVGKDLAAKLYNNGDWITLETYFGITSEYNY
ncbi:MAG: D-alanyl-D-alanine carboxypeptidase family protein [Bacilli bacterium]|nr:D-alanyl-D-alanine carboxypeptidase family protein [Bacilli bacterium]